MICSNCGHDNKRGHTKNPLYSTWNGMISRCNNKNNGSFKYYGGRGIKVCDRWLSFENFLEDMGERPDNHSLDRIDSNGNYEPNNCRWSTKFTQSANQSNAGSVPGVHFNVSKNRWIASQKSDGKYRFWKSFKNREEALTFNAENRLV